MSGDDANQSGGGDSIVTELVQALGTRIKSIEVDRVISETERRVTVRIEVLSLEDVKMAYIDTSNDDGLRLQFERCGIHGEPWRP